MMINVETGLNIPRSDLSHCVVRPHEIDEIRISKSRNDGNINNNYDKKHQT